MICVPVRALLVPDRGPCLRDTGGPRVVIDNDYKLVVSGPGASDTELFNLRHDPAEQKNLAADEPAVVAALAEQLRRWQDSTLTSLTGADYR